MADETDDGRTRRDCLGAAGAFLVGGATAGCLGGDSDPRTTRSDRTAADPPGSESTAAEESTTDEPTTDRGPTTAAAHEACIEPAGCLTFEDIPETYLVYNGGWADMAFALGQREGFLTAGNMIPGFFFDPFDLSVPPEEDLPSPWQNSGWSKELFLELDPDVILMDPEFMHGVGWDDSWDEADTERLAEQVAPFFGNNCRRRREFHDHKLYSLYGAFERLAALFDERERYEAFREVHDTLLADITSRLPPAADRPAVGLLNGGSNPEKGKFYPLSPQAAGYEMKPYRDLGVESAWPAEMVGATADYEELLAVDPEIIVVHWGIGTTGDTDSFSAAAFREQYVTPMEEDPVGSQLTAVQAGNVYPGQYGEQGPIVNLLQTEMVAQQLSPEEFGAFAPEQFPDVPADRRLFDRERVRAIIAGEL
jgi:iron complex transport system substrate-binding protein